MWTLKFMLRVLFIGLVLIGRRVGQKFGQGNAKLSGKCRDGTWSQVRVHGLCYESPLGARSFILDFLVTLNSPVSPEHSHDWFHTLFWGETLHYTHLSCHFQIPMLPIVSLSFAMTLAITSPFFSLMWHEGNINCAGKHWTHVILSSHAYSTLCPTRLLPTVVSTRPTL